MSSRGSARRGSPVAGPARAGGCPAEPLLCRHAVRPPGTGIRGLRPGGRRLLRAVPACMSSPHWSGPAAPGCQQSSYATSRTLAFATNAQSGRRPRMCESRGRSPARPPVARSSPEPIVDRQLRCSSSRRLSSRAIVGPERKTGFAGDLIQKPAGPTGGHRCGNRRSRVCRRVLGSPGPLGVVLCPPCAQGAGRGTDRGVPARGQPPAHGPLESEGTHPLWGAANSPGGHGRTSSWHPTNA